VHHDLNAWISVCLKFESLKNEFEKKIKKKKENLLPLPLFSPRRPNIPFSPQTTRPAAFFFFFTRAQSAQAGPASLFRRPSTPPPFFLFAGGR
jgi:hypothetical protein